MLDTEAISRRAWQQAAADCGVSIDDDLYARFIGLNTRESATLLQSIFGVHLAIEHFCQASARHFEKLISNGGAPTKSGLFELLSAIDDYGYLKAVATSSDHTVAIRLLDLAGISSHIDYIVGGDQVSRSKPAPDIFVRASTLLGVSPPNCLVLEDSNHGIQAAHEAGMAAILVPDLIRPTPETSAKTLAVVNSLHEVIPLLAAFAQNQRHQLDNL